MNTELNTAPTMEQPVNGFEAFNLPRALMASLAHMKYTQPTPVQSQAIPAAIKGKDVIGSAQTGTGKTGAFIIPILARLMTDPHASALIMTPTRELASQILVVARQMMHTNMTIKTALLIGGESMGRQVAQMSARPRLVVGTPGRINDHLRSRGNLFATTNILVLDEADRMLDMGFTPQINDVIKHMPTPNRQTLMFSATFPDAIIKFTKMYMNDPIRVTIEPERTSAANITHETIITTDGARYGDLTKELYDRKGSIILFIKTKHGADRMGKRLIADGHSVDVIHGGLSQRQRDRAIAGFRAKKTRIMVATDVAARGLDVPHIEHVINYDLPQVAEDYVHRIGRTARNGLEGRALSFLLPSERGKWNAIQRVLNPGAKIEREPRGEGNRGGRSGGNRNGSFKKRGDFRPREDRAFEVGAPEGQPRSNDSRPQNSNTGQRRDFGRSRPQQGQNQNRPERKFGDDNFGNVVKDDNRGNTRSFDQSGPERNFNVEGANGEAKFSRDADRPFKPQHERKPAGAFFKKKKFFGKGNAQGKSFGNGGKPGQKRPLDRAS